MTLLQENEWRELRCDLKKLREQFDQMLPVQNSVVKEAA